MADPVGTLKNISELIKKYNDLELMKQIVALQTEVFELQTESLALKKQIIALNEREKMTRREPYGYYYKEDEEVPHCPKCWENEEKGRVAGPRPHGRPSTVTSNGSSTSLSVNEWQGLGAHLDCDAWEMVEMMRRLARTR